MVRITKIANLTTSMNFKHPSQHGPAMVKFYVDVVLDTDFFPVITSLKNPRHP